MTKYNPTSMKKLFLYSSTYFGQFLLHSFSGMGIYGGWNLGHQYYTMMTGGNKTEISSSLECRNFAEFLLILLSPVTETAAQRERTKYEASMAVQ